MSPVVAKSKLIMVAAMALSVSVFAAVLFGAIFPIARHLSPGESHKFPSDLQMMATIFTYSFVGLTPVFAAYYLFELRKEWAFQSDGIVIKGWFGTRFIPWADVHRVKVALFTLTLCGKRQPRRFLNFINGPKLWHALPAEKRQRSIAF